MLTGYSLKQEGNDQKEQDQAGAGRARDPRNKQPPIHCYPLSFIPIRGSSVFVHGIL